MPKSSVAPQVTVSLYDARPFFEKALQHGVAHGLIGQEKLAAIAVDAPKGMVQIARYFGNENLRPELEKARDRMVNLVSLNLELSSGGDLQVAAEMLRDHSFLSRSKGGSDMLKALLAMPRTPHFGMTERSGFTDDLIPVLADWALKTLPDYQLELSQRSQAALVMDAAIWLADTLGLQAEDLEEAGKDAEAVIRTALLVLSSKRTDMPDWVAFEKMVVALRKKYGGVTIKTPLTLALPKKLPAPFHAVVEAVRQSVLTDLPKILDAALPVRKLFDQTPAFMGRYFWIEDSLSEVDHYDRSVSDAWQKATQGHDDEGSLLTLFLCIAAGSAPKTLLTATGAKALIRKLRTSGLDVELASDYIRYHAPEQHQDDYETLWAAFVEEASPTLLSDYDYALNDALALLRLECNVK